MADKSKVLEYSKNNFANYQAILQDFVKIHRFLQTQIIKQI